MEMKSKALAGVLVLAAVLFFVFTEGSGSGNLVRISGSGPLLGRSNAPVTIVVFGDYQCKYTKQFFDEAYPRLKESYIDTGKVNLVYRQYPVHGGTWDAANAALCAHDQGKFWPYNSIIINREKEWSQEGKDTFKEYANELGLDAGVFSDCLEKDKHRAQAQKDFNDGKELGVSGTPTFFINGVIIKGFVPFERFESVLSKFRFI